MRKIKDPELHHKFFVEYPKIKVGSYYVDEATYLLAQEYYKDKKRFKTPQEYMTDNKKKIEEGKVYQAVIDNPRIADKPKILGKQTGVPTKRVEEILINSDFKEILDKVRLSDGEYAQAISNKFYEHYNLKAGEDDGFIKLADMVGKMKGLFKTNVEFNDNKTPESLKLVKTLIDGEELYTNGTTEENNGA